LAARYGKPLLTVDVDAPDAAERAAAWLKALLAAHAAEAPFRLGIGGPRESEARGIYRRGREFVRSLIEAFAGSHRL
jgi:hypothetical protein